MKIFIKEESNPVHKNSINSIWVVFVLTLKFLSLSLDLFKYCKNISFVQVFVYFHFFAIYSEIISEKFLRFFRTLISVRVLNRFKIFPF